MFFTVKNGSFEVSEGFDCPPVRATEPTDEALAEAMETVIRRDGFNGIFMCSSSMDFPEENGLDLDGEDARGFIDGAVAVLVGRGVLVYS